MKTNGFASQHCNVFTVFLILVTVITITTPFKSYGQVRAGIGYLKMLPGTREMGVAGTLTGALDYTYSFHANPGATGFLREWQWSASYTNWISDLYSASFLYGKKINTLWSRRTRFAIGMNYMGIPEFDSSNETAPSVSGNNLLVTASFGQPLSMISPNISVGANIKYFNSKLAQYDAHSLIFDYGFLCRTNRVSFLKPGTGFLDHVIFSAGFSITNTGQPIQYISEGTPLPKTLRAGVALNLGTHNGVQLNLGTDYRQVRDEDGFVTFGSEISWNQLISMRMGYSLEENVFGRFTFGGSLQLDDNIIKNLIPGKNSAVRLDMASNQNNQLIDSPYHGSITHFSIGPEYFELLKPSYSEQIKKDMVELQWQPSDDSDLYDEINYWLIADSDSLKLAKIIKMAARDEDELFSYLNDTNELLVNLIFKQTQFDFGELVHGDYYWSVFSFDKDQHIRFGEMNGKKIAHFHVTASDPKIIAIHFDYSPWITQDDYQGKLKVTLTNFGDRTAEKFILTVYDSMNFQVAHNDNTHITGAESSNVLSRLNIPDLHPGELDTLEIEWKTSQPGYHHVVAEITQQDSKGGKYNDRYSAGFFTIPKGTFSTADSVVVLHLNRVLYELPNVGKVFFEINDAEVDEKFIREWIMSPPLTTFAERIRNNPELTIYLRGSADALSGEDSTIARKRALAVRDTLQNLGVSAERISILPDTLIRSRRLPRQEKDADWVLQDRKFVEIKTDLLAEEEIFGPLQTAYDEVAEFPVTFQAKIASVVPMENGYILLSSNDVIDTWEIDNLNRTEHLEKQLSWLLSHVDQNEKMKWLEKPVDYSIVLVDTLGRQFKSYPQNVVMTQEIIGKEKMYYVIAKFAETEALYHFYWLNLLDRIPFLLKDEKTRMGFVGHGCAIGPEKVNQTLSEERARYFHHKFLKDVKKKYPELYDEIVKRIDPPKGLGENEPLSFKSYDGKQLLLGDNETPIGRQLNRRVMVHFYSPE